MHNSPNSYLKVLQSENFLGMPLDPQNKIHVCLLYASDIGNLQYTFILSCQF